MPSTYVTRSANQHRFVVQTIPRIPDARASGVSMWRDVTFLLLVCSTLLTGCNPMNTQAPMTDVPPDELVGAKAELVDEARQIYRFSNGVCRALADIPAPWTLSRGGHDEEPIRPRSMSLEAPNTAFDISPPGRGPAGRQRYGRGQEVIDLVLGTPSMDDWLERIARNNPIDPGKWRWPMQSPFPLSSSFQAYAFSQEYARPDSSLLLVNEPMHVAVKYDGGLDMPNPTFEGVVVLGPDEVATFRISYEGLSRLSEVVASMTKLSASLRVDCSKGVNGDE